MGKIVVYIPGQWSRATKTLLPSSSSMRLKQINKYTLKKEHQSQTNKNNEVMNEIYLLEILTGGSFESTGTKSAAVVGNSSLPLSRSMADNL